MKVKYLLIGLSTLATLILAPYLLELAVFRNSVPSVLANGEWSSFLGSYIGGIFGGLGTLFAVYVTVKQTRDIQKETFNQIVQDRNIAERNRRIAFTNNLINIVSKYITDTNDHIRNSLLIDSLNIEKKRLQEKISPIIDSIQNNKLMGNQFTGFSNGNYSLESDLYKLQSEVSDIDSKSEKLRLQNYLAEECYYKLTILLDEVNFEVDSDLASKASHLLYVLEDMQSLFNSSFILPCHSSLIKDKSKELRSATSIFVKAYITY